MNEPDRQRAAAVVARFSEPVDPKEWRTLQAELETAVRTGEQDFLFALHDACEGHRLLQSWPRQHAWRAAGSIADASALRRFLERARTPPSSVLPWGHPPLKLLDGPARTLGAMLAFVHPDDLLERELEHFGPDAALRDLFACWIHERIVRGSPIGRSSFVQQFCRALPASHPLAPLPLECSALESGLLIVPSPRFDLNGNWFDFRVGGGFAGLEPEGDWHTPFEEFDADARALAAVASDPALCPNSTIEARCYRLATRPPSLRALSLQPLALDCLSAHPARVKPVSAREVMGTLMMLGTLGGAYAEARSAAHGRRLAWHSLTALVGLPAGAPFPEVEALAGRTDWLFFGSDSPWFDHVGLDVGLVALRADSTVAVVAMTDSD